MRWTKKESSSKGSSLPPGQRDLSPVFQNYALWPHMKVDKSTTFALEIRKIPQAER
jgi:ABC-type sugar transport system ATPase subunit